MHASTSLTRRSPAKRTDHAWPAGLFAILALLLVAFAFPAHGQGEGVEDNAEAVAEQDTTEEAGLSDRDGRLPADRRTSHSIEIDGETMAFEAVAGALTLRGNDEEAEADIAYVAYLKETDDPAARPVTFAVNGGPGAASAYLHIGVLGPWLLPMEGESIVPSQPVGLVENAETWLEFTDLVFVDPVGTGFSRLVEPNQRLRERYLSVDGDIEALSRFVTRWLADNGRLNSPKYFVGESYGGFRGPLLAEALQTDHGVALNGMVLLSPVLDFGWWAQPDYAPMPMVSLLPSLAAAEMERSGDFSAEDLRQAEDYAAGEFVTDLLRGLHDEDALERLAERVGELTGLDEETVRDNDGRIDMQLFAREHLGREGRIASIYDTTISAEAPIRSRRGTRMPDPVLDAMTAPLTSAMLSHYSASLQWLPDRRYQLLNRGVNRAWNWGSGRGQPESVSALRRVLSLDPQFRLLVVHGYTDLVTPYFASELILRQIRPFEPEGRVRQENYRGGHMFYTRDDSRRAFHRDARRLYQGARQ